MTKYTVKTFVVSDENGMNPGAFQSVFCADQAAQLELESTDGLVETWTLETSFNVDRILDTEENVISYSEIE